VDWLSKTGVLEFRSVGAAKEAFLRRSPNPHATVAADAVAQPS
jgi:hypothetical protein